MTSIVHTSTFPLPPRVRSAFYLLESSDQFSVACDLHSECVHLLQSLLDSGSISCAEYSFYIFQAALRLQAVDNSLWGGV